MAPTSLVRVDYEKWDILSYMGRVNYGFDDRYLLTLTMRVRWFFATGTRQSIQNISFSGCSLEYYQ